MRTRFRHHISFSLLVVLLGLFAASPALGNATITIQNNDAAGAGFNDPTPVAPVGGNNGTTLGQQRLIAFQFAAGIWGATINSVPTVVIQASWSTAMPCTATTATLGSAGATGFRANFPNAPIGNTFYPRALANAMQGSDPNLTQAEISAMFNARIGQAGCLGPPVSNGWYLGLDGNHGNNVDLVTVLLHEFSHGLGFQSIADPDTGAFPAPGLPGIFDKFLRDNSTGKTWDQMTNGERLASAVNTGNLVWAGPNVIAAVPSVLGTPRLRVNSPGGIAGLYTVGTAEFGPRLSTTALTANVAATVPTDGCAGISNASSISGKIALIDRGNCNFTVKVKNAQNAGAVAVIIGNNVAGAPPGMGGFDNTIVIPSVSVSQSDANTFRNNLGAPINASIFKDSTSFAGTDGAGRVRMFAPNPVDAGSSVSHYDDVAFPNLLMEPTISGDLTHNVAPPFDLTFPLFLDLGWTGAASANPIDTTAFFVRQHYLDFFSREPDAGGLTFWTGEIDNCAPKPQCTDVKRINVSGAFFLSIEFQETGYLVYRMYKTSFGNLPGAPVPVMFVPFLSDTQQIGQGVIVNVGNWQAQLEANKQAFALAFVQRTAFTTAYPNTLTAAQIVDQMNANAGGVLSATERNNLIATMTNPNDVNQRAQVLRAIAEDVDLRNAEFNKAFVLMQYFGYLRRNPNDPPEPTLDFAGYNFWLNKLNQFNGNFTDAEMVKAFITSIEYRQRFGTP